MGLIYLDSEVLEQLARTHETEGNRVGQAVANASAAMSSAAASGGGDHGWSGQRQLLLNETQAVESDRSALLTRAATVRQVAQPGSAGAAPGVPEGLDQFSLIARSGAQLLTGLSELGYALRWVKPGLTLLKQTLGQAHNIEGYFRYIRNVDLIKQWVKPIYTAPWLGWAKGGLLFASAGLSFLVNWHEYYHLGGLSPVVVGTVADFLVNMGISHLAKVVVYPLALAGALALGLTGGWAVLAAAGVAIAAGMAVSMAWTWVTHTEQYKQFVLWGGRVFTDPARALNEAGQFVGNAARATAEWVGTQAEHAGEAIGNAAHTVDNALHHAIDAVAAPVDNLMNWFGHHEPVTVPA